METVKVKKTGETRFKKELFLCEECNKSYNRSEIVAHLVIRHGMLTTDALNLIEEMQIDQTSNGPRDS